MSRIEFISPVSGRETIDEGRVIDVLGLAGVVVRTYQVQPWSQLERLIAYDWAWREYLSASDNPVQRRPKPHFVTVAEKEARTP